MGYLDTVLKDYCERSYNWLNGEEASTIAAIVKKHGCTSKRVAQQRGALGMVKVIVRVHKFPGWYSNNQLLATIHGEIAASVKLSSISLGF